MVFYNIVAFFGCLFGYLIAKFTKEELKAGGFYFKILELIILLSLSFIFLYQSFEIFLFVLGVLFGILLRYEYFYFGFGLFSALNNNFIFLSSALVFLYGLPYGSLNFYKKNLRTLIYSLVWFFLASVVYFLDYNMLSFAAGGLLSLFVIKLVNVRKSF